MSNEMTASLSRCPSSPPAPPLEDENLLPEILLRLPPEPSSLPRASAVCKRWRHLVSDARFFSRFRLHHRRNPPLLGFFHACGGESFQPSLETPNRVSPGRFSLRHDHGGLIWPLGCRHGLVLRLDVKRKQALVLDPVTGGEDRIALPPRFDGELTHGAVLRLAGDVHFQVVLVVVATDDELLTRALSCVYSSETGIWGNLISQPLPPTDVVYHMPAVLVGDSLYWILIGEFPRILEFDLERQSLAVIPLPMDMLEDVYELTIMRAEGGGLGFLFLSREDLNVQLWKRMTDCDGVASWELRRTVELGNTLCLDLVVERMMTRLMIVGFAECNNAVFLRTCIGLFIVQLEPFQFKRVLQDDIYTLCQPFESVYAAGI